MNVSHPFPFPCRCHLSTIGEEVFLPQRPQRITQRKNEEIFKGTFASERSAQRWGQNVLEKR
jgi:hypothetical protein